MMKNGMNKKEWMIKKINKNENRSHSKFSNVKILENLFTINIC